MVYVSITILAIIAIVLGLIILVWPKFLRWAIGLYLILFGVIQLLGQYLNFSPAF